MGRKGWIGESFAWSGSIVIESYDVGKVRRFLASRGFWEISSSRRIRMSAML